MKWIEGPALFYYTLLPLVGQLVKNPPAMWETLVPIPELGRSRGEGNGYPLQYSGLENSMDCIVHGGNKESETTEGLSLSLHLQESPQATPLAWHLTS